MKGNAVTVTLVFYYKNKNENDWLICTADPVFVEKPTGRNLELTGMLSLFHCETSVRDCHFERDLQTEAHLATHISRRLTYFIYEDYAHSFLFVRRSFS